MDWGTGRAATMGAGVNMVTTAVARVGVGKPSAVVAVLLVLVVLAADRVSVSPRQPRLCWRLWRLERCRGWGRMGPWSANSSAPKPPLLQLLLPPLLLLLLLSPSRHANRGLQWLPQARAGCMVVGWALQVPQSLRMMSLRRGGLRGVALQQGTRNG